MDDLRWTNVLDELPPEGVEVLTLSPGRMEQALVRQGRLWFLPDRSMYVYYGPTHWRPSESDQGKKDREPTSGDAR